MKKKVIIIIILVIIIGILGIFNYMNYEPIDFYTIRNSFNDTLLDTSIWEITNKHVLTYPDAEVSSIKLIDDLGKATVSFYKGKTFIDTIVFKRYLIDDTYSQYGSKLNGYAIKENNNITTLIIFNDKQSIVVNAETAIFNEFISDKLSNLM